MAANLRASSGARLCDESGQLDDRVGAGEVRAWACQVRGKRREHRRVRALLGLPSYGPGAPGTRRHGCPCVRHGCIRSVLLCGFLLDTMETQVMTAVDRTGIDRPQIQHIS